MNKTMIHQMLRLEQLCYSKFITQQLLGDLVSLCVKSIDYSGSQQNFAKIYFMEKMQIIVAKAETNVYAPKMESSLKSEQDKDTMNTCDIDSLNEFPEISKKESSSLASSKRSSSQSEREYNSEHQRNLKINFQFQIMDREGKQRQDLVKKLKKQLQIKSKQVQNIQQSTSKLIKIQKKLQRQIKPKLRRKLSEQLINQLQNLNGLTDQSQVVEELKSYKQQLSMKFNQLDQKINIKNINQKTHILSDKTQSDQIKILILKKSASQNKQSRNQFKNSRKRQLTIQVPNKKSQEYLRQSQDQEQTPKFKFQSAYKTQSSIEKYNYIRQDNSSCLTHQEINDSSEEVSTDNYF